MSEKEYTKQELSETGREIGIEAEESDETILEPFDPSKIIVEPKVVSMDAILRRLKQGTIILSPSFQRKEVWTDTKKSLLIESLMLSIPLPMFYVAADDKGRWEVVDGLQRLSAIRDFLHGDKNGVMLKLQNLEFLGERFNGKTFKAIENNPEDQLVVNTILETELRFTVINPGTPEIVKRNIFKRINTGGMPLTTQEIRHALYEGESTHLLNKLVSSDDFKSAIGRRIDDSRMGATELVLRLVSFMIFERSAYKGSMDAWLSNAMRALNQTPHINQEAVNKVFEGEAPKLKAQSFEEIESKFRLAMHRAKDIFGRHAFRKSLPTDERLSPVNKSLFEVWSNILAELPQEYYDRLLDKQDDFFLEYEKLLKDIEFVNLISRHSSSPSGILQSYQRIQQLVMETLGE